MLNNTLSDEMYWVGDKLLATKEHIRAEYTHSMSILCSSATFQ